VYNGEPLHWAAEEAWMSIEAVRGTAARLRMLLNVKGLAWAAARDGERSAATVTS
jgi:hypothetical protein